jgi:hypothetical protein
MHRKRKGARNELLVANDLLSKDYDVYHSFAVWANPDIVAIAPDDTVYLIEVRSALDRINGDPRVSRRPGDRCTLYAFVQSDDTITYMTPAEVEADLAIPTNPSAWQRRKGIGR